MPTIKQLPTATSVNPADEVPVSQGGATNAVAIGTLLSGMQPAIMVPTGMLLGRNSLGQGGPEPVEVGTGVALTTGTLVATGADHAAYPVETALNPLDQVVLNSGGTPKLLQLSLLQGLVASGDSAASGNPYSITGLPTTNVITASDLVGISQSGNDKAITLANFLEGETIDQGSPAGAARDTDTIWVGQGGSTMLVQSFAAIWNWIASHLPGWKRPVVEITSATQLDASVHNAALLVCTQPVTITPAFETQGNGFWCTIINMSSGVVSLGAGIVTSGGQSILSVNQAAHLYAVSSSAGNVVYAAISGGGSNLTAPGQVTGLAIGTVTSNSLALSWTAPSSGGAATSYTINYRVTGTSPWLSASTSATSYTVTGLNASTGYDFEVFSVNAAGSATPSAIVTASTSPASPNAPNTPTGVAIGAVTSSSIAVSWTAPAIDVTHGAASTYTVQWRTTGSTAWTQQIGVSGASFTLNDLSAATQFDIQVQAVNSAGGSAFTATTNATTGPASGNYLMGSGFQPLGSGTSLAHSTTVTANASDMSASADGSYTVPANVYFGWTTSATTGPASTAGLTAAEGQITNGGHNYWYHFAVPTPSTPGTYYFWSVEINPGGTIVASVVQGSQVIAGGTPVAFTIT